MTSNTIDLTEEELIVIFQTLSGSGDPQSTIPLASLEDVFALFGVNIDVGHVISQYSPSLQSRQTLTFPEFVDLVRNRFRRPSAKAAGAPPLGRSPARSSPTLTKARRSFTNVRQLLHSPLGALFSAAAPSSAPAAPAAQPLPALGTHPAEQIDLTTSFEDDLRFDLDGTTAAEPIAPEHIVYPYAWSPAAAARKKELHQVRIRRDGVGPRERVEDGIRRLRLRRLILRAPELLCAFASRYIISPPKGAEDPRAGDHRASAMSKFCAHGAHEGFTPGSTANVTAGYGQGVVWRPGITHQISPATHTWSVGSAAAVVQDVASRFAAPNKRTFSGVVDRPKPDDGLGELRGIMYCHILARMGLQRQFPEASQLVGHTARCPVPHILHSNRPTRKIINPETRKALVLNNIGIRSTFHAEQSKRVSIVPLQKSAARRRADVKLRSRTRPARFPKIPPPTPTPPPSPRNSEEIRCFAPLQEMAVLHAALLHCRQTRGPAAALTREEVHAALASVVPAAPPDPVYDEWSRRVEASLGPDGVRQINERVAILASRQRERNARAARSRARASRARALGIPEEALKEVEEASTEESGGSDTDASPINPTNTGQFVAMDASQSIALRDPPYSQPAPLTASEKRLHGEYCDIIERQTVLAKEAATREAARRKYVRRALRRAQRNNRAHEEGDSDSLSSQSNSGSEAENVDRYVKETYGVVPVDERRRLRLLDHPAVRHDPSLNALLSLALAALDQEPIVPALGAFAEPWQALKCLFIGARETQNLSETLILDGHLQGLAYSLDASAVPLPPDALGAAVEDLDLRAEPWMQLVNAMVSGGDEYYLENQDSVTSYELANAIAAAYGLIEPPVNDGETQNNGEGTGDPSDIVPVEGDETLPQLEGNETVTGDGADRVEPPLAFVDPFAAELNALPTVPEAAAEALARGVAAQGKGLATDRDRQLAYHNALIKKLEAQPPDSAVAAALRVTLQTSDAELAFHDMLEDSRINAEPFGYKALCASALRVLDGSVRSLSSKLATVAENLAARKQLSPVAIQCIGNLGRSFNALWSVARSLDDSGELLSEFSRAASAENADSGELSPPPREPAVLSVARFCLPNPLRMRVLPEAAPGVPQHLYLGPADTPDDLVCSTEEDVRCYKIEAPAISRLGHVLQNQLAALYETAQSGLLDDNLPLELHSLLVRKVLDGLGRGSLLNAELRQTISAAVGATAVIREDIERRRVEAIQLDEEIKATARQEVLEEEYSLRFSIMLEESEADAIHAFLHLEIISRLTLLRAEARVCSALEGSHHSLTQHAVTANYNARAPRRGSINPYTEPEFPSVKPTNSSELTPYDFNRERDSLADLLGNAMTALSEGAEHRNQTLDGYLQAERNKVDDTIRLLSEPVKVSPPPDMQSSLPPSASPALEEPEPSTARSEAGTNAARGRSISSSSSTSSSSDATTEKQKQIPRPPASAPPFPRPAPASVVAQSPDDPDLIDWDDSARVQAEAAKISLPSGYARELAEFSVLRTTASPTAATFVKLLQALQLDGSNKRRGSSAGTKRVPGNADSHRPLSALPRTRAPNKDLRPSPYGLVDSIPGPTLSHGPVGSPAAAARARRVPSAGIPPAAVDPDPTAVVSTGYRQGSSVRIDHGESDEEKDDLRSLDSRQSSFQITPDLMTSSIRPSVANHMVADAARRSAVRQLHHMSGAEIGSKPVPWPRGVLDNPTRGFVDLPLPSNLLDAPHGVLMRAEPLVNAHIQSNFSHPLSESPAEGHSARLISSGAARGYIDRPASAHVPMYRPLPGHKPAPTRRATSGFVRQPAVAAMQSSAMPPVLRPAAAHPSRRV